MSGWDEAETAFYYEAFCARHTRYMRANAELIAQAQLAGDLRILDLGAGTGRTAEAALGVLGEGGTVFCVEPAAAMRAEGMRRVVDRRVTWSASLPNANDSFDRIVCGAAMWQLDPLAETFRILASLLRHGGALSFNIPALYLMEPDEPGGGEDPLLLSLPEVLVEPGEFALPVPAQGGAPLSSGRIDAWLKAAGFARTHGWSFRLRLTQEAYADWLKIPVLTGHMLAGLTPHARAERIEAALGGVDRASWKWERRRGWTAWN